MNCGIVDCTGKNGLQRYYLVCEYRPPGNVVTADNSQFRANVLEGSDKSGDAGEVNNPTSAATTTASESSTSAAASETSETPSPTNTAVAGAVAGSLGMSSTVWTVVVGVAAVVMAGGMS